MTAIYVHIPYCIKKCSYCDFCSVSIDNSAPLYCDALKKEIQLRCAETSETVETVFFGGGTPTILPSKDICSVLDCIKHCFKLAPNAEISIECNPGTATLMDLCALSNAGFNRLSIGLQSASDSLLKTVGRAHSFCDFKNAYAWARQAGFKNINVDVMHGLPNQSQEDYNSTLRTVCDMGVEHISAYGLILEQGTELYRRVKAKELSLPDEDEVADMQDAGLLYLSERGYERYEISNFAKKGYSCRHNLAYWNNDSYLGFGVAAHSSMPYKHYWQRSANTESIATYLKQLAANKLPTCEVIELNKHERMFESVMLGLRKIEGIDKQAFFNRYGVDIDDYFKDAIASVKERGWWTDSATHLQLNARGLDMQNSALVYFR